MPCPPQWTAGPAPASQPDDFLPADGCQGGICSVPLAPELPVEIIDGDKYVDGVKVLDTGDTADMSPGETKVF